jgi:hypothetical protein
MTADIAQTGRRPSAISAGASIPNDEAAVTVPYSSVVTDASANTGYIGRLGVTDQLY